MKHLMVYSRERTEVEKLKESLEKVTGKVKVLEKKLEAAKLIDKLYALLQKKPELLSLLSPFHSPHP